MKTITLSNQKGGVSKTTSSIALATGLCDKGYRVIAADLDPQCNFTQSCGIDPEDPEIKSLYDVFKGDIEVNEIIKKAEQGFDVIPGGLALAAADREFVSNGREYLLSDCLDLISDNYDFCIIDTAPSLNLLTENAMTASNYVIIPTVLDTYSINGMSQLIGLIKEINKGKKRFNLQELEILGILLTNYKERENNTKIMIENIVDAAEQIGTKVFDSRIRISAAVRDTIQLFHGDIFKEAPKANATIDYDKFVDEVLRGVNND